MHLRSVRSRTHSPRLARVIQITRPTMIRDYSDHAANERTFLAWLRTGIAVIAFV